VNDSSQLQHVGVLGMHWGHRSSSSASEDYTTARKIGSKKLSDMSNAEIQKLNTRMQLEVNYKSMHPGKITKGARAFSKAVTIIGTLTAASATIGAGAALGKKFLNNSPIMKDPSGLGLKVGEAHGKALIKVGF